MATILGAPHVSRVRMLYKTILRLHRGLPVELKALGDEYVKSEFKRHKAAEASFVGPFMKEWAGYALQLAKQLRQKNQSNVKFGAYLDPNLLDEMSSEQITQMYELYRETTKPIDPENPLGSNPNAQQSS